MECLAAALDGRAAVAAAVAGAVFGWGRRTVTTWLRAATLQRDCVRGKTRRDFYHFLLTVAIFANLATVHEQASHDETRDFWVDALQLWWTKVRTTQPHVKRLVIDLDNGPKNSGTRTQFLKRMVPFADGSGLEIRLVYSPLYHSKSHRIGRCWSSLENKWSGTLLTG